jgi:hypothetical protein
MILKKKENKPAHTFLHGHKSLVYIYIYIKYYVISD